MGVDLAGPGAAEVVEGVAQLGIVDGREFVADLWIDLERREGAGEAVVVQGQELSGRDFDLRGRGRVEPGGAEVGLVPPARLRRAPGVQPRGQRPPIQHAQPVGEGSEQ